MATVSTSKLAAQGGNPVRDIQRNPWPTWPQTSRDEWRNKIEPALRAVYESHEEGGGGSRQQQFAERFATYNKVKHCCLVAHGTDALAGAIAAALDIDGFGDGGEVIVPNYTYIASASAVLDMQCSVVFADIDPRTFTLDPKAVEAAIDPKRTRAIMPVHIAGQPCDMDALNAIARKHNLVVIEDCAQAHGATHRGTPVGGLGDAGGFSFQSSKNLCSGEGGAITSNDTAIFNRAAGLMNAGRLPAGERWHYARVGWNYRPSEYLATLLSVRLDDLEAQAAHRHANALQLCDMLAQIPGVTPPALGAWTTRHAWHLYPLLIDPEAFGGHTRDEIVEALSAEGIPASPGYTSLLSDQAGLQQLAADNPGAVRGEPCPVTQDVCARSVWFFQNMLLADEHDISDIAEAVAKVRKAFGNS
jgi:dTDP-4-amino-4,6-dideoxygalactose transaminase